MRIGPTSQAPEPSGTLVEAAGAAKSLEDLAELLRALRRRHARANRDTALTYREMAQRTGWSQSAIAEYFTARTLPPTDRFDALLEVLSAAPAELRALAEAHDRVEENIRRAKQVRQDRPAASAVSGTCPSPPAASGTAPRQLPADTALFTGREQELEHLLGLAGHAATEAAPGTVVISAIDGMGGIGKTALAIHAAHRLAERFPDGQLFIDLYGFTLQTAPREPSDALATLLSALAVSPGQIPPDTDARAALYRDRLADTRTLLVLDNALDEAQVRPLIPAAPGCLVLITSRRRLKSLDDAVPLPLDVLAPDEAVALLRQAARVAPKQSEDSEWERVAELCGHLPLALMIAGALLRTGGRAWTLDRLTERLARRVPEHELAGYTDEVRDLSSVFNLSYEQLPAPEQSLFRCLGLLPGPEIDAFGAAALLGNDPAEAEALVQHLADHSLLIAAAPGRYRVHDLVRAHANSLAAVLDPQPDRDTARDRLFHYYGYVSRTASVSISRYSRLAPDGPAPTHIPGLSGLEAARAWLRAEQANLDAAFAHAYTHGLDGHAIDLAAGLAEILLVDGPWKRALEVHRSAAETAERLARPADQAGALTDLGHALYLTGDYSGASAAHTSALKLQCALGNRHGEATALHGLGRVQYMTEDDPARAVETYTRALEIHRLVGDRRSQANALTDLGRVWLFAGDHRASGDAMARALEVFRVLGDRLGEATALHGLGRVRQMAGEYSDALDLHTRAVEIFSVLGDRLGQATALTDVGDVRRATGDYPRALDAQTQAVELFRMLGNRHGEAAALNYLGDTRRAITDYPGGLDAHSRALEINHALGNRNGEAAALLGLGRIRQATGDYPGAVHAHTRALDIYQALGDRGDEAYALNHYAAAVAATGQRARALALYQQALAMNQELSKPDDEAISLEGIGEHYLAQGDRTLGAANMQQALTIYQRLGMRVDADRVQARLSNLATRG
jgi:tetratricopeptide (TPR) repeat protein/transcriptional regulator with XRE-family HTH domain